MSSTSFSPREQRNSGRLRRSHTLVPIRPAAIEMRQATREDKSSSLDAMFAPIALAMQFLRRQYKLLAAGLVLGLLLLPLAWLVKPPAFTSTATVMIDTSRVQLFPTAAVVAESPIETSAQLESQLEILNSSTVAKRVMDRLKLHEDPAFAIKEQGRLTQLFGPGIARALGREPIRTEARRERFRLDIFASNLTIRRVSGTFAVEIAYRSDSATQAALVANTVAETYLEVLLEMRQDLSRRTGSWLQSRVNELRDQLAEAQRSVSEFKARHGLHSTGGEQVTDRQLGDLNSQIGRLRPKSVMRRRASTASRMPSRTMPRSRPSPLCRSR